MLIGKDQQLKIEMILKSIKELKNQNKQQIKKDLQQINRSIKIKESQVNQSKMTQKTWLDITSDILKYPKSFKLLQTVRDDKFPLEDGMHAHEINDNKIDPKYNICEKDTIGYMLSNKLVKLPSELSSSQLLAIFVQTYKLQSLLQKGYPLHNTIYTFTYLYDQQIYKNAKNGSLIQQTINTLVNSINCLGSYFYQLHKDSASIKQDDLNITMYSFSTVFDSHQQIVKDFTAIQNLLAAKSKEDSNYAQIYLQILALVRLRRALHNLAKSLGKIYDHKLTAKIQKDMQAVYSAITSVEQQFAFDKNPDFNSQQILQPTGIYSQAIYKTLRTHFGPRELPKITFNSSIMNIKLALDQICLFIPVPNRASLLKQRIQRLLRMELNIWSKSYIKNNMFHKEEHIFSTHRTQDVIFNDISDYIPVKQSWKTDEKFMALFKPTGPVVSEVLFRYLGRDTRSFWQVSKIYEDYNILIHLSNQFDAHISPPNKKELHVSSWYYNFGLNVMIKQLFSGIEIDLYQHYEYPYVFYLLQNLLAVYDRNSQIFLKKFDKTYIQSFFDDTLNNKKKKKTNEATRKYFTDTVFKKALHYYARSLHRLFFILVHRKLMPDPFSQNLQLRIKNRFKIFKNIYFVRTIDYQQYIKDFNTINQDQNGYLTEAMDLLKQAKNLFQKITQLQDSDCFFNQKEDAENLMKICVKCSLAVISLKMGQNTKTFKMQNKHPKYPEVTVN